MSNYLKIYDFIIRHKQRSTNTEYFTLALNSPELSSQSNIESDNVNIKRQVVFDTFLRKLNSDLNREVLKNKSSKKIIKQSINRNDLKERKVLTDYENKIIYGVLNAGKITENAILEKVNEGENNEYSVLDGDRIYDDFFFLLHISFSCNISRLFILSRKNNTNVDAVLKSYLRDNLFKANNFKKTTCVDFIPKEYRAEVLDRSIISNVLISKSQTILTESDNEEYEVEIRLKPKSPKTLSWLNQSKINIFKGSKVIVGENASDDINSEVRFSINDPETKNRKTISFGDQDNFMPRFILEDDEILNDNLELDIQKLKTMCMNYIKYNDNNQLFQD